MNKGIKAFVFMPSKEVVSMVVTDKSIIKNSKDEHFQEVTLIIPESEILKWADEINNREDDNNEFL